MERKEWSPEELRHKAEMYCASAEHCESEMREKLSQWGGSLTVIESIIAHLREGRYIDDKRYCDAFVHDKLLYLGWGRRKIQVMLQCKKLPASMIHESINSIDEMEYSGVLRHLIVKKKCATREQVARFCLQRGFLWEEIEPLLNNQ